METIVAQKNIIQIESLVLDKLIQNTSSEQHLKCILRIISLFSQKPYLNVTLTANELRNDPIIISLLKDSDVGKKLEEVLICAEKCNILTISSKETANMNFSLSPAITFTLEKIPQSPPIADTNNQENIFAVFEENISPLTPIIAEELKKAKSEYPESMIKKAIIESAKNNARSWRYISRILERWQGEGQKDGRTQRYPARTKRY